MIIALSRHTLARHRIIGNLSEDRTFGSCTNDGRKWMCCIRPRWCAYRGAKRLTACDATTEGIFRFVMALLRQRRIEVSVRNIRKLWNNHNDNDSMCATFAIDLSRQILRRYHIRIEKGFYFPVFRTDWNWPSVRILISRLVVISIDCYLFMWVKGRPECALQFRKGNHAVC